MGGWWHDQELLQLGVGGQELRVGSRFINQDDQDSTTKMRWCGNLILLMEEILQPGMFKFPVNKGMTYLSTGAGFLPSTVGHGCDSNHRRFWGLCPRACGHFLCRMRGGFLQSVWILSWKWLRFHGISTSGTVEAWRSLESHCTVQRLAVAVCGDFWR